MRDRIMDRAVEILRAISMNTPAPGRDGNYYARPRLVTRDWRLWNQFNEFPVYIVIAADTVAPPQWDVLNLYKDNFRFALYQYVLADGANPLGRLVERVWDDAVRALLNARPFLVDEGVEAVENVKPVGNRETALGADGDLVNIGISVQQFQATYNVSYPGP